MNHGSSRKAQVVGHRALKVEGRGNRAVKPHLMSRDISVIPPNDDGPGSVLAGFHSVGHWDYV